MNELTIINQDGKLLIDSREVAEMIEKQHKNLLADIRNYEDFLTGSDISPLDFFIKSTYTDAKGEARPNYQVTKKGCEFIAHKLTKGRLYDERINTNGISRPKNNNN